MIIKYIFIAWGDVSRGIYNDSSSSSSNKDGGNL